MKFNSACKALAVASAAAMLLAGCGGGDDKGASSGEGNFDEKAKTSITFAGWSLDMTPEFQTLADGFHKAHPNVTVNVKQYSANDYDTQLTADISSGAQPDVFPLKNLIRYVTYAESQGLADISDLAKNFESNKNINLEGYKQDDKYFALPYRSDVWVLFYNKDMFKKVGLEEPNAKWTWDDYTKAAKQLKEKLPAAGYDANSVYPMYMHSWQAVVQSFALSQSGKSAEQDFLKGDYSYLEPYYKRALEWQDDKLTIDWNTASTNKIQYQPQFGTQKAAMMPMGTWYAAALLTQQKSGDAQKFNWGMAPIPQNPDKKLPKTPITFGSPTSLAISSKISGQKLAAAKEFVKWAVGEGGSNELAKTSTTPAFINKKVIDTFFATEGMATDQKSKDAWSKHDMKLETPVSKSSDTINSILADTHSSIMTETKPIGEALKEAAQNVKDQGVVDE